VFLFIEHKSFLAPGRHLLKKRLVELIAEAKLDDRLGDWRPPISLGVGLRHATNKASDC
jgi:hypothetical protein